MSFEVKLNFELIGTLIGLAIYNSVLLELHLPKVIYKKLLDEPVGIEDLQEFDPLLYATLTNIIKADNVNEMGLTFNVSYDNYGMEEIVDLKQNGRDVAVTNENKKEFVNSYVNWYLNDSIKAQFEPFYEGFYKVISHESIKVDFTLSSCLIVKK